MALMRTGFGEIKNRFNAADYLRRVDPEIILDYYGARNRSEQRNGRDGTREIVHSCLIDQVERHHANADENPSAAMNLDKATYACYGYWMGGIFEFIMKMEQKEHLHEIIGVLKQFLGDVPGGRADRDEFLAELEAVFRGTGRSAPPVPQVRYNERAIASWTGVRHPYAIEDRRFTDRAYDALHLGYDPATRRLVFPHYVGGRLVGWQQRAIPDRPGLWSGSVDAVPKYKNNPSFPKSSTIYHLDRVDRSCPVVVVESPASVAWAVGQGFDQVVATFGASVPDGQIEVMRELGPLVLWFDDDGAGLKAERKVCERLMRTNQVSVVTPDPGKDMADSLSIDDVQEKIAGAKPAVLKMMDYATKGIR